MKDQNERERSMLSMFLVLTVIEAALFMVFLVGILLTTNTKNTQLKTEAVKRGYMIKSKDVNGNEVYRWKDEQCPTTTD